MSEETYEASDARSTEATESGWYVRMRCVVDEDDESYSCAVTVTAVASRNASMAGSYRYALRLGGAVVAEGDDTVPDGQMGYRDLPPASFDVAKTHDAQSLALTVEVARSGGPTSEYDVTHSVSMAMRFTALETYPVVYDGNGASDQSPQVKWHGEPLSLREAPSLLGSAFAGWACSADGRTYAAGGEYAADESCTMRATWTLAFVPPSVSVEVSRVESSGSTEARADGGYACVSATWSVDATATPGNSGTARLSYRRASSSAWTALEASGTASGTGGTATAWFAADPDEAYEVRAEVADANATVSRIETFGSSALPIDVRNRGRAVGVGAMAGDDGVTIGSPVRFSDGWQALSALGLSTRAVAVTTLSSVTSGTVSCYRIGDIVFVFVADVKVSSSGAFASGLPSPLVVPYEQSGAGSYGGEAAWVDSGGYLYTGDSRGTMSCTLTYIAADVTAKAKLMDAGEQA